MDIFTFPKAAKNPAHILKPDHSITAIKLDRIPSAESKTPSVSVGCRFPETGWSYEPPATGWIYTIRLQKTAQGTPDSQTDKLIFRARREDLPRAVAWVRLTAWGHHRPAPAVPSDWLVLPKYKDHRVRKFLPQALSSVWM